MRYNFFLLIVIIVIQNCCVNAQITPELEEFYYHYANGSNQMICDSLASSNETRGCILPNKTYTRLFDILPNTRTMMMFLWGKIPLSSNDNPSSSIYQEIFNLERSEFKSFHEMKLCANGFHLLRTQRINLQDLPNKNTTYALTASLKVNKNFNLYYVETRNEKSSFYFLIADCEKNLDNEYVVDYTETFRSSLEYIGYNKVRRLPHKVRM